MSMRINPPDYIKCKNYERYKQELLAWKRVTEVDKKKQAIAIALSLPADGEEETGIREKVFEELKLEDLEKDNGLDTLIAFFDKNLGKDDLSDSFQKFEEFEECIRRSESIRDYIQNFDQKYNRLVKLNMTLPKPIVAFKLLKGANISKEQRMLVLTGLDFNNKEGLYEQAKASLKKYLGDNNKISNVPMALKVESTHSTDQEALVASNYTRRPWQTRGGFANRPMRGGNHWRGSYQPQTGRGYHSQGSNTVRGKKMNPAGSNGRPLLCKSCGSFRHLLSECPDSYERMPQVHWANDYPNDCHDYDYDYPPEDDNIEENEDRNEDADVFFANNRHSMKELSIESRNCAVLDSGCSSNVCGQAWFDCYVDSLSSEERRQVIEEEGRKTFKFGGGEKLKSLGCFFLPAHLAGKKVTIKTDVVASNLPLLLSKEAMKKAKVKLNLIDDTAEILGKEICLNHTSSGHYCVPLDKVNEVNVEEVYAVNINTIDKREQRKTLTKLHRQFAHPSAKKFVGLLKDGGVWSSDLQEEIDAIYKSCDLCRVYSEQVFHPGDRVFYKREGKEKWLGPAKVVCQDGKIVFVRHGGVFIRVSPNRLLLAGRKYFTDSGEMHDHDMSMRSKTKDHGLVEYIGAEQKQPRIETETQEQPRIETQEQPRIQTQEQHNIETDQDNLTTVTTKTNLINLQRNDRIKYKLEVEDEWKESTILCRGGKRTGQNKNWFNIKDSTTDEVIGLNLDTVAEWQKVKFTAEGNKEQEEVNIVMVPREKHEEEACVQAKLDELQKLKAFSTYESVPNKGQTTISTRWVLSRKGDEVKARLVARGFEDQEIMRKDAPTVGKSMMRTMIAIAATNSWSVKTTDIKSAFLQGRDMEREVYIKPPKEADVENGMIWKLKKCLYGLNEAARQFYQSVADCLLSLGCTKSALDPALFYMKKDGQLKGIIACHIDDFLHAGDEEFDECMTKMRKQFLAGKLEMGQFKYIGFNITQNDHHIIIDQTEYVKQLENATINAQRRSQKSQLLNATESTTLRELVGRLNWVAQGSRPDIFFEMIELSTRLNKGTVNDLTRAIKAVKNLKEEKAVVMMPKLHKPSNWRLVVFSDASHANLSDGANSMGAHLVFLTDGDRSCPISWHAGKIKRVVRSTIAAETLSLLEAVENGIYIREHLMELLGLSIPLHAYIDNKSLVEAVHSTKLVDDKRLRIDMSSLQESLSRGEINTIQWIPGDKQLANCLTKKGASPYHLLQAMQNGYIQIPWAE